MLLIRYTDEILLYCFLIPCAISCHLDPLQYPSRQPDICNKGFSISSLVDQFPFRSPVLSMRPSCQHLYHRVTLISYS
ncbi:hypothetical protein L1887_28418 [Cichorium endivia]|nr:hypothetical protein L1887_28418 [Cichorium endivia]